MRARGRLVIPAVLYHFASSLFCQVSSAVLRFLSILRPSVTVRHFIAYTQVWRYKLSWHAIV